MNNDNIKIDNSVLLETLQGGVVYSDFDPPFHLRYSTEGMAELSGYTIEELSTMKQMDLVCEQDVDMLGYEVAKQFGQGNTFSVEYRLKKKDGSFVYVLDRAIALTHDDGRKYIHCLLTDISDLKNMEQALWLSQEKYRIALKESGNVVLELNLKTNLISFSENYSNVFNLPPPCGDICEVATKWLDPLYLDDFLDLFNKTIINKSTETMEIRIVNGSSEPTWGILHLAPVINEHDEIYAIIGCLKNIHDQKKQISHLTELSERDGLTGVYNRTYMEDKVNSHIKTKGDSGALFIIDIDYFKDINDTKGHSFGDEVLRNLVAVIKKAIPEDSVIGRLGGDEFLIFSPTISKKTDIENVAIQLGKVIFSANKEKVFTTQTTVSIGATAIANNTDNFTNVYKRADKALYATKANGRNGYTIV